MNADSKPYFIIRASHLGPILTLEEGKLSDRNQNLIFARNGTGKSFLARAFRYLDLYGQEEKILEPVDDLVSEEAEEGKFSFSLESKILAEFVLKKPNDNDNTKISDVIFHVFSEDFVQRELRRHKFNLQDDVEGEIAMGSENIEILTKEEELGKTINKQDEKHRNLQQKFENEKESELVGKAKVRKNLTKYREINFENLLKQFSHKPDISEVSFKGILKDLDNLKAIPTESVYPEPVPEVGKGGIDLDALEKCLQKITLPSSVSEKIKEKINLHHEFYRIGTRIIQEENRTECPYCEQDIANRISKKIIEAYINYFADEEEKHKNELRNFYQNFERKKENLKEIEARIAQQGSYYDNLKQYVPSQKSISINNAKDIFSDSQAEITTIINLIKQKAKALDVEFSMPKCKLFKHIDSINDVIKQNNMKLDPLIRIIENTDSERREVQGRACDAFQHEFVATNWSDIEDLKTFRSDIQSRQEELAVLRQKNPSKQARDRVVETFHKLLNRFFANKYIFDEQEFILKRDDKEMRRGVHRTLSDGEKTAIAFCWFIARIHCKVKEKDDYSKIFLVFDDPVTSMSYDFVFSIVQTLKDLNISNDGEISIDHSDIDGNKKKRPRLLILTHNSYFLNISRTNGVVGNDAIFSLYQDGDMHKIDNLRRYVAPFNEHLRRVFKVSEGDKPDSSTGNAIRSVLEAIGYFCRPDKSEKFQGFLSYLSEDEGIPVESTLINSLCHGNYYDEIPTPEDLKRACEVTITVVERFAPGQLEVIKDDK